MMGERSKPDEDAALPSPVGMTTSIPLLESESKLVSNSVLDLLLLTSGNAPSVFERDSDETADCPAWREPFRIKIKAMMKANAERNRAIAAPIAFDFILDPPP